MHLCSMVDPKAPRPATARKTRRRIWEVAAEYHCMICGTCLSTGELRKLVDKARLRLPPDISDFRLHGHVVHAMATPGPLARLTQKVLDRKYHAAIKRCAAFSTESELD